MNAYRVLRAARRETLRIRGLDMHLRSWGPAPRAGEPRRQTPAAQPRDDDDRRVVGFGRDVPAFLARK